MKVFLPIIYIGKRNGNADAEKGKLESMWFS